MDDVRFGFSLVPTLDFAAHREVTAVAEESGLEFVGVQDHPYVPTLIDTFALIADLLARTRRLRFFPDVANLPLRPPALLAKHAAALDLMSEGRFELGLGGGGYWDAITTMGVPRRTSREAADALEEAVRIMRALWREDGSVTVKGEYYSVSEVKSGPAPAHRIGIWLGAQGPRALRQTGRIADGWAAPIPSYLPYEKWAESNALIDEAAREAGRDPGEVVRVAQIVGTVTEVSGGEETEARTGAAPVRGTADEWARLVARLATEQPFRTFIFWPEQTTPEQIERFATQVVPAAKNLLA